MLNSFKQLDTAFGRLYETIGTLVGLVIAGFVIGISVDLFLRLFGLGTLAGVQEIIEYALFACVFLTAPWLLRLGAHVRVDLLLSALPRKVLILVERAIDVFGCVICIAMAWFTWVNLANSRMFDAMLMKYFNVPEWWLLAIVLVSFALLAIEFVFRFFRADHVAEELDHLNEGM
jgi:TRAP-type C4-dicarboxylate transport system permease small subunit